MIKKILGFLLFGLFAFTSFSNATQIGSTTSNQNQVLGIDLTNGQVGDFVGVSWINSNSNNVFEITSLGSSNWNYDNGKDYNNIFQGTFGYNAYEKGTYFWNNGKLVFHSRFYGSTPSWDSARIVNKFAKVSASDIGNFSNYSFDYSLDEVLSSNNSFTHQVFAFRRGNDGSLVNSFLTLSSKIIYCLGDGNIYYCASCVPGDYYTNPSCNGGSSGVNLGLTAKSTIDDIKSLGLNENSPVVESIKPSYEISPDTYTYGQIVEGYEACGLDVGYCFGGFPIDDIFEPNQTIEDFTGYKFGYGANIRYLYSLYSSSYTPKQFFNQMLLAYNNGQINRFKNEPKALIMFVQQYVSGKERGLLNVGFYDLWDYCNIKLGYTDLNLEYTGHNQTPKTCYKFKVSNESNQGGYTFTGDNAYNSIVGSGKQFKNASEFFGKLSSIFNNGIGSINTNYSGFIPTYILVFMFAFIFIRLISK